MHCQHRARLLLVSIITLGCQPSGPESKSVADEGDIFNGRPVSAWVEQLRHGPVQELTQAGEEAMPVWIAAARDVKAARWVRHTFTLRFDDQAWTGPVYMSMLDLQGFEQRFALGELARNQPACRQVASPLMAKIRQWQASDNPNDEHLVQTAVRGIRNLRPVPDGALKLVRDLWPTTKTQMIVRSDLMEILGCAGPQGVDAVVELCLQNDDAINELWHFLIVADQPAIAAILTVSESESVRHRRVATLMIDRAAGREDLSKFHAQLTDAAIPRLRDSDTQVQKYALSAIGELAAQPSAVQAIPILAKWMHDPQTRDWATRALGSLGSRAEQAIPALKKQLESKDLRIRLQAADALWQVSQNVELVLPVAREIAADDQGITTGGYGVRYHYVDGKRTERRKHYQNPLSVRAANLLGDMGAHAKPAVGELIALLAHSNARVRSASARALGEIGPAAIEAVPALQKLIRDDPNQQLVDILHNIDPNAPIDRGNSSGE